MANDQQARVNYMLNCQGCHTPDGSGFPDKGVPSLKGFMGKFLRVSGGREFLIQVPGAAQSTLNSAQLAEMTNWMLTTFDPGSMTADFLYIARRTELACVNTNGALVHFLVSYP
jgi:mono/diheme cytochrome c family protein